MRLPVEILLLLCVFYTGVFISRPSLCHPSPHISYYLKARCEEELRHHNYILSAGKQKFYLSHFYTDTCYRPGDSLVFYTKISPILETANPGEFSYSRYLKQKGIYYRLIPLSPIQLKGYSHTVYSYFNRLRTHLVHKTSRLTQDSTCQMLINALCLGYKNDLDSRLQDLFLTTGTIHLLSVSGLHTGAIYLLFIFLLKHLGLPKRKVEWTAIPLLWAYACLTGLSPSVVRASTILSFIASGKVLHRTYIPINTLAASAFFTLLFQPSALYSLSFLLSYSAYSGILILHPFFLHLLPNLPSVLSKLYTCCCITIAAQLPTLPLSAYYFHTININGFLANIIAVPLATILLYSSAICLFLPVCISQYFIFIPTLLGKILIRFLQSFSTISINITDLYPSSITILLLYFSFIGFCLFLNFKNRLWLRTVVISTVFLLTWICGHNLWLSTRQEILIVHQKQYSGILLNRNGYYTFLKNNLPNSAKYFPYIRLNKLKPTHIAGDFISGAVHWQNSCLYTPSGNIYIAASHETSYRQEDILIITDNLSPNSLFPVDSSPFYPGLIITDGSNNRYIVAIWQKFCDKQNISFWDTSTMGSIRIPIK